MKFLRWLNILAILTFLSACNPGAVNTPDPANTLPPPYVTIQPSSEDPVAAATTPDSTMTAYLDAFKVEDYNTMYSLLSKVTQDAMPLEDFALRNRDALNQMSASSFDYEVLSSLVNDYSAEVSFRVTYHTVLVGDIQRDMIGRFSLENQAWRLQWEDALILPELAGGNRLRMDYEIPSRGNIYDRDGDALVAQSDGYAFYVLPGNVNDDSIGAIATESSRLCGTSVEGLIEEIYATPAEFPIRLCVANEQESQRMRSLSGILWYEYNSRYYFQQGVGSNVVGYTQVVPAEELEAYRRRGYAGDELVGRTGIERWAEEYLSGKHGGTLQVVNPSTGAIVTQVGKSEPQAASSIHLTIDRNLQYYAEKALQPFTGAAVVIERDTGRVLAMATSPGFDANAFQPNNPNGPDQITDIFGGQFDQPLLNRAAQGQYPLGSVFKIITMAAGMESGLYTAETTFPCEYEWTKLPDRIRYDWTWQHCLDRQRRGEECNSSDSRPSGNLTLPEGLMRSCNPFFWDIGYTLYQNNRPNDIANMARAFGLGQRTGIQQIEEEAGNIPNAATAIDVVNEAIGQGDVLVTPLQVARFVAAIGNGGTLYRPQLVEKIEPVEGDPITVFKPEAIGTLPIQPFRLELIQQAMVDVINNPRGTAYFRLRGINIPAAGKTGTAETNSVDPHAWFAGYTMASESTGVPDIAIAVVLEYQGEGSDWAAPIFKRLVETYYQGSPQTQLWFEQGIFGPTHTPTPIGGVPTPTEERDN